MRYAIATAEAEGKRLSRELQLYDLPVEAYAGNGKYPMHDALTDEALRLMGSDDTTAKQASRQQEAREQDFIRKRLDAEEAGDWIEVERLELEWNADCARRKEAGENASAESQWAGDVRLITKGIGGGAPVVQIHREAAPVN